MNVRFNRISFSRKMKSRHAAFVYIFTGTGENEYVIVKDAIEMYVCIYE